MRNPWLARNPWMSMWMSGANTIFHTWRAHAVNAGRRTLQAQAKAASATSGTRRRRKRAR
jgi:hypothetical protein